MNLSRWLRRIGQTTTEYMVVVAVISIGAMWALAWFSDPNGKPQQAAADTAQNFADGLGNDGGIMKAQ